MKYRSKSYGSETISLVKEYAFIGWAYTSVVLCVTVDNTMSIKLFKATALNN